MPASFPSEEMAPEIAAVLKLVATLAHESWFAAVGEPLTEGECEDAAEHLAGLGFPGVPVDAVDDWNAAKATTTGPDWDPRWWDREEALRRERLAAAEARFGESQAMEALTAVVTAATEVVHGHAAVAATRAGVADPALARVAAGAATQACYQAGLDRLTGGGTPFAPKFRLFQAGRWPLGIVAGRFLLF